MIEVKFDLDIIEVVSDYLESEVAQREKDVMAKRLLALLDAHGYKHNEPEYKGVQGFYRFLSEVEKDVEKMG